MASSDAAVAKLYPARRTAVAALGLIAAAVMYPVSRQLPAADSAGESRLWLPTPSAAEVGAVLAAGVIVAAAAKQPTPTSRRILAAGWAAHALYDAAVKHDARATRLPAWYAPFCAGADIAIALRLVLVP